MAKLSAIKTDLDKEVKGVWLGFAEGIQLLIASIDTKQYRDAVEKLLKQHTQQLRSGALDSGERLNLVKPAIAKYILLGWKNIDDEKTGKPIPYSYEKALEILTDPENKSLVSFILQSANDAANYRKELVEDAVKN